MKEEIMSIYEIEYELGGVPRSEKVEGSNPGHAFAKFQKENPEAKVLRASLQSRVAGHEFWIEYQAPKVQREPEATPKIKDSTEQFAFMESVATKEK